MCKEVAGTKDHYIKTFLKMESWILLVHVFPNFEFLVPVESRKPLWYLLNCYNIFCYYAYLLIVCNHPMQMVCTSMVHLPLIMDTIRRQASLHTPCHQPCLHLLKKMLLFIQAYDVLLQQHNLKLTMKLLQGSLP
jgi:hypothetical protein